MRAITFGAKKNNEEKKDAALSTFVCAYFFLQALNLLVKMGDISIPAWNLIPKIILGVLLLIAIPALVTRSGLKALLIELTVGAMFVFSSMMDSHPDVNLASLAFDELVVFVPIGICAFCVSDYSALLIRLHRWSYPSHFILYVLCFLLFRTHAADYSYSMSVGYAVLFQMLIMIDSFTEKHSIIDLILVIADLILIVMLGSRGPLLCLGVYAVFRILSGIKTARMKSVILMLCCFIGAVLYLLYPYLLQLLVKLSSLLLGNTSRTIRLLLNEQLVYEAGRETIYSYTLERIMERPILGWGVGGGWLNGVYPHNLLLEIALSFGVPFAIVITIWLLAVGVKGIGSRDREKKSVFLVFLSCSVSLLFSGSFLLSSTFFVAVLLGMKSDRRTGANTLLYESAVYT